MQIAKVRDKQALWKLLSEISRTAPGNLVSKRRFKYLFIFLHFGPEYLASYTYHPASSSLLNGISNCSRLPFKDNFNVRL